MVDGQLARRAERHAALGDPARLAMVEELWRSDRTPSELQALVGLSSNLMAHHLEVLERAGVITRSRSSGDGRRRYTHLDRSTLAALTLAPRLDREPALFVCTRSSARSQLAAAWWRQLADAPATSAGTHPAERVHPEAVAAAVRAGLDLSGAHPRHLDEIGEPPRLVVTVCDRAHEELEPRPTWLHWSIADPVSTGTAAAFDAAAAELGERIGSLLGARAA